MKPLSVVPHTCGSAPFGPEYVERFWSRVKKVDVGCWLYTGGLCSDGCGVVTVKQRSIRATRFMWMLVNGPIPPGLLVCHTCDNPTCVRPDHLWLGTNHDNMRDMMAKGRKWYRPLATHCIRGHEFTPENVRYQVGSDGYVGRRCLACSRLRGAAAREKKRARIATRVPGMGDIARHDCNEPLSFETRDGISYERCATCRYEAPVPRRAPTSEERKRDVAKNGKPRVRKECRALLPGETRECLCGCGALITAKFARYAPKCRYLKHVRDGKASGIARARTA